MLTRNMVKWMNALLLLCGLLLSANASAVEKITYLHTDALGSPIAASDANGKLLWKEDYHPFGEPIRWETNDQRQLYTAQPYDDDLKLSYYGARWYDPAIGRFMGVDPAPVEPGNIYSFNRYAYANNNPYKYVDPDGEAAVEVFTDLMPAAGRSFGNLAAYAYGIATGNQYLIDAANFAMSREQVDGLSAIAAIVEPPGLSALNKAKSVSKGAGKAGDNVIHVTTDGVALPPGAKYRIPDNYVQNPYRPGSYGEMVNGKFKEKLRIDPPTQPGKKGPNYSHYHKDGKGTHYSPKPGDSDPGF